MRLLRLVWRSLLRDWRAGELRLMGAAVVLAVAATSAVGFFTDRVHRSLLTHANTLLAADLVVTSADPLPDSLLQSAAAQGLAIAQSVSFRSILTHGDALQLSEIKAVDDNYPLRGQLAIANDSNAPQYFAQQGPRPGEIWVEPRLLPLLNAEPGDPIGIGYMKAKLARLLMLEPDRGGDLFSIAPRAMMNLADLDRSGLIQPASRATYRLLLAGEEEAVMTFHRYLKGLDRPAWRIVSARDARPEVRSALDRSEQFLSLGALVSVLVAGIAIASSSGRFVSRHLDSCALLRCLGLTQNQLMLLYGLELAAVGAIAGLLGCALGYATQFALSGVIGGLYAQHLPLPSLRPVLDGCMTALVALLGFSLPRIAQLRHVSALRIFRRDLAPVTKSGLASYSAAAVALVFLAPWHSGNYQLTLWVLFGTATTAAALTALARVAIALIAPLRQRVGVAWRYGIASVVRRSGSSVGQILAIGIGVMVLLLLGVVRQDLLSAWEAKVPEHAPNHFLINVQADEVADLTTFLAARDIPTPQFYPMVRARLLSHNGRSVKGDDYVDPRAQRWARREFNLSWAAEPQKDNRIIAGRWWDKTSDESAFSVEQEFAATLGWSLGDELTFRIADQTISGHITSLRTVAWDSFNVNFFVVARPGLLNDYARTYVTSFYLAPDNHELIAALIKRFPSVTFIDVAAVLSYAREIMMRVNQGVGLVFSFTLLAGLLVLFAAIQATHDVRLREAAVLRALGASAATVRAGFAAEFLIIGLLAGATGALGALVTAMVLAEWVFRLEVTPSMWLIPWGLLLGALGVLTAGFIGTRRLLATPPLASLS